MHENCKVYPQQLLVDDADECVHVCAGGQAYTCACLASLADVKHQGCRTQCRFAAYLLSCELDIQNVWSIMVQQPC